MQIFLIVVCCFAIQACTYNSKLPVANPLSSTKASSKQGITLLDNRDQITDLKLKHGVATLNYDLRDSLFSVATNALKSAAGKVDIAKEPISANPLYAVSHFEIGAMRGSDATTGLTSKVRIDLFETSTKQSMGSVVASQDSQYLRPGSLDILGFVTGLTLFVISPITLPQAVHIAGDAVGELITANEKGLTEKLSHEVMMRQNLLAGSSTTGSNKGKQPEDCFQRMREDPSLDPLRGKLFSANGSSRFDMLTNNGKPTKTEKDAIKIYYEAFLGCFAPFDAALKNAPREVISMFESLKTDYDNLLASLYNGEITYGAYIRRTDEIAANFTQHSDRVYAEIQKERRADARAQAQLEIQDRQALAAADLASAQYQANWMQAFQNIQQNMLQIQTINSINRLSYPSPRLGVNCTSRAVGGAVNTNCY